MKRLFKSAFAIGLLLASSITLADHKDGNRDNGRGPPAFAGRHNDRGHDRDWDDRRDFRPAYRTNRYRDYDDDSLSISLHFGTVAPRPFGYNPYGYNMLGYRGQPFSFNRREPVVIYQNNTYIDPEPSYSGSYVTRRTNRQGVSLLRDSSGRCYERVRDSRGNETRTELPASNCNF